MTTLNLPSFYIPERLKNRPLDLLPVGSAILEQVIRLDQWPAWGGQNAVRARGVAFSVGGCATNVACYAARLGGKVALVAVIGAGRFGQEVWKELVLSGVDLRYVRQVASREGNLVVELTNPEGDWTVIDVIDPEVCLTSASIPPEVELEQVQVVHLDGFSYVNAGDIQVVQAMLEQSRKAGCLISVDGSVPAARGHPQTLRMLYEQADIAFANLEEAFAATQTSQLDTAIRRFQSMGPALAVIKVGAQGSYAITPNRVAYVPACQVEVVDTVGAGDAYIAACLFTLTERGPLELALARGSAAGALACRGMGSLSSRFSISDVNALAEGILPLIQEYRI